MFNSASRSAPFEPVSQPSNAGFASERRAAIWPVAEVISPGNAVQRAASSGVCGTRMLGVESFELPSFADCVVFRKNASIE